MQASTVSPVTNFTTISSNTTTTTKSREQVLIQSSGAMIAVIVIGIIIILTILLIILKTYNRRTHVSRVLGASGGSKPRQKKMSSSTVQSSMPMSNLAISSVSGSITNSNPVSENGFRLPRVELNSTETNNIEQFSTTSGSTVVTIHDAPSLENT
ncbi:noncompact myelin-associated protein [Myripristis murdjan]|uniref:noncompact myelin-associated protein n=1 Tax=Myripristis murdjan TaxID=586833 RepID=UPI001175CD67|nr:noncompact myelin-associated protein [Myripristis murdjan]